MCVPYFWREGRARCEADYQNLHSANRQKNEQLPWKFLNGMDIVEKQEDFDRRAGVDEQDRLTHDPGLLRASSIT